MIRYCYILLIISCFSCKTTKDKTLYYSYEKDTKGHVLHGPVKRIYQYGKIDTSKAPKGSDKLKYYSAGFMGRPFDNGGNGMVTYDTLGMIISRQTLKKSIDQRFSDTVKAHRMHIYHYEYNQEDVKDKLQYKQSKKFPFFVHNPYRVKIAPNFYQAYEMTVEKDSSYKKIGKLFEYSRNKNGLISKEERFFTFDYDLDGKYDKKESSYFAEYIYDDKNQLIEKKYKITEKSPMSINIDDFEFDGISKSYSPIIRYEWDDKGNLITITTHPDKDRPTINHKEQYWYNEENQLIKKRRLHPLTILRNFNKHIRAVHDLYFDERGNVIKIEAIDDDRETVYATYLFEYADFDEYGNWTTCYFYGDGVKTEEPTGVTNRIIEYYETKEKASE